LAFLTLFSTETTVQSMKKHLWRDNGLTAIEVTVATIIALMLTAAAIPLYQGYVKDMRISATDSLTGTLNIGSSTETLPTNATAATTCASCDLP
jgi:Tfp pilus assembly protein PilE